MPVWGALLGTLGYNVSRHLRGKSTLCSSARTVIPAWLFDLAWAGLTHWLRPHYRNGFKTGEEAIWEARTTPSR